MAKPTCSEDGCGREVIARGRCDKHWQRARKSGELLPLPRLTLEQRFWAKVDKNGPTMPHMESCCWVWTGAPDKAGYGHISIQQNGTTKMILAHRVSWELDNGPVPLATPCVCHRCDNPICVRLDHLFAGTHQDNMDDRNAKKRNPRGEGLGTHVLTESQVREIRKRLSTGEAQHRIAKDFGIHQVTVSKIHLKKLWGHLD